MRNIKKKITVKTVVRYFYDRTTKEERTDTVELADGQTTPALPENCILLESQTVSEKEVVYTMTPEKFIANATAETK